MFTKSRTSGFTLIELLVVVAIIAMLASIVVSSLNVARAKARDARRMQDIHEIDNAIQLYIADNGHAPYLGCDVDDDCVAVDTGDHWGDLASELSKYIPKLPVDPMGGQGKDENGDDAGYYSYYYATPGHIKVHIGEYDQPFDNSSYLIAAQLLESTEGESFSKGFGSF